MDSISRWPSHRMWCPRPRRTTGHMIPAILPHSR
ncbi:hypothetical protein RSOL_166690 [Rhizoctonia solani AG-3 Rhs1AP]|uniref:Uncharacterized protein n=1 Tax=Rhizoctonia solani AG-3 Rhs1AP TaxID=1086054 RepID=X8J3Y9_9AGAM|nr:hypothetical protein RSOL_166690 [Rhizoctonia solani AG-3 Rhs1AP]